MSETMLPPAPWRARVNGRTISVVDKTGRVVARIPVTADSVYAAHGYAAATFIAAAPELYEALKFVENCGSDEGGCPCCYRHDGPHDSDCILGNALAKAEGRS